MSQPAIRRLVICVDNVGYDLQGKLIGSGVSSSNTSTIFRLQSILSNNVCYDDTGRQIVQTVRYCRAAGEGPSLVDKFRTRVATDTSEQQIKDLTKDVSQWLIEPDDELYFFGFGRGAYVVRAVAGVLHHMGIPSNDETNFDELYQSTLDLIKALKEEDSRRGGKALELLRSRTKGKPNIQLVGVFDTTKITTDKQVHDTSFVGSIKHFRQALSFNETKSSISPDALESPEAKDMDGRSFVQAWFLGYHGDLGGGFQHDGLSLYPLQWMLLEAMRCGLVFERGKPARGADGNQSTLALTFPQFAGDVPHLGDHEKIEWLLHYTNGLEVSMFDLQTVHSQKILTDSDHALHFNSPGNIYASQRKIFSSKSLIGWNESHASGTIIHPSVFMLFDRNPRFWEQSRFKPHKQDFGTFQYLCMKDFGSDLPPWLEGSELTASGVKAFRILVCGKTGVGKSTLINRVFGVQMTEESNTYDQGNHDINTAFESPSHPGLLIHDSRGWQAGSDHELELIAKFLRHRAFQKDPAEALHVIWFCVDSDVSRIEEADKRTFETIAQYSHDVPVFVIGTKKDKLVAYRKMDLLHHYMTQTNDYQESLRLANEEADKLAQEQFFKLRDQLQNIKSYKADGYCCLSKDDDVGVKRLLADTLDLISDERVRLFCVAAQVVDVDKKVDSAITESMRLGVHAIRSSMVPLPFSGIIATPTVSRILCEHVLQCFGFPKALPDAVDDVMSRVVFGNLKSFMAVSMTQFMIVGGATIGLTIGTFGVGALLGGVSCLLSTPPTARMILKCAADMILILERSFRYGGKYVSVKQIEDAAKQYTVIQTKLFSGKEKRLQDHVHDEIDKAVPLKAVHIGFKFSKLRLTLEDIIYSNRFDRSPEYQEWDPLKPRVYETPSLANIPEIDGNAVVTELADTSVDPNKPSELVADHRQPSELSSQSPDTLSPTSSSYISPLSTDGIQSRSIASATMSISSSTASREGPSLDRKPSENSSSKTWMRKLTLRRTKTKD